MAAPICNPEIPSVHPIPGGMYPGRMIRVKGSTPAGAERFEINLQCGADDHPFEDIAFHLNPRFDEMCVCRNHFISSMWGDEKTTGDLPLIVEDPFEILITCFHDCFKVALNGTDFCEFAHHIPYHRISHVTVKGDVIVHQISLEGASPPQQDMVKPDPSMEWKCHACLPYLREVPNVHPIPGGMYPGRMIRVKGATPIQAKRFAINLQCGPKVYPREDIALHVNPRFDAACIVRNHFLDLRWGNVEIIEDLPLRTGDSFEVAILCCLHCFKMTLNGVYFYEFLLRIPVQRISHICVDGDVMMQQITFEGASPPQEMFMATTDPLTVVEQCTGI